mgnify:CR=1 FL=1
MLIGFECQGFIGSPVVAAWLNWPLWLVFAPIFAFFSFKAFVVAVLVWLPLVTYAVSVIKLRRLGHANISRCAPWTALRLRLLCMASPLLHKIHNRKSAVVGGVKCL